MVVLGVGGLRGVGAVLLGLGGLQCSGHPGLSIGLLALEESRGVQQRFSLLLLILLLLLQLDEGPLP